jgi:hypothetical protein
MSDKSHVQMQTINWCFSHMRMQQCSTCAASLHFLISHHLEIEFRIGLGGTEEREKERERAGGMTKWPIAHLENVGKGICPAIRLFHQSRHWPADPSLLVTAEPKPLRLPLAWNAER